MSIKDKVYEIGRKAKEASLALALLEAEKKNKIMLAMAKSILKKKQDILKANRVDVVGAEKAGESKAIIDRLMLNDCIDCLLCPLTALLHP